MKNLVVTLLIQDGENQRNEYITEVIEDTADADKRGEEILHENFTSEELANGFYWDSSWEKAGSLYAVHIIENDETFKAIRNIIG